jgi:hypothetical protein
MRDFLQLLCILSLGLSFHDHSWSKTKDKNLNIFEEDDFFRDSKFSYTFYVSYMGPSLGLPQGQTYNPFLPDRAPYQIFHSSNLRWQINNDWAIGATLAGFDYISGRTKIKDPSNMNGFRTNNNNSDLFNARAYVVLPTWRFHYFNLYNTLMWEFPTSSFARDIDMQGAPILSQNYALNLPPSAFSGGVLTQFIKYLFDKPYTIVCTGCSRFYQQTALVTVTPYVNYRINNHFQLNNLYVMDWDQKGDHDGTTNLYENLPNRFRTTLNYFPGKSEGIAKYFNAFGFYIQTLEKSRAENTIIGFDLSLVFR